MDLQSNKPPKRKRARKVSKDPDAPKKPSNAFIHFAGDISALAAYAWKKMSDEQKAKYVEKARLDKLRYKKELAEYLKKKGAAGVAEKKGKDKRGKKK